MNPLLKVAILERHFLILKPYRGTDYLNLFVDMSKINLVIRV